MTVPPSVRRACSAHGREPQIRRCGCEREHGCRIMVQEGTRSNLLNFPLHGRQGGGRSRRVNQLDRVPSLPSGNKGGVGAMGWVLYPGCHDERSMRSDGRVRAARCGRDAALAVAVGVRVYEWRQVRCACRRWWRIVRRARCEREWGQRGGGRRAIRRRRCRRICRRQLSAGRRRARRTHGRRSQPGGRRDRRNSTRRKRCGRAADRCGRRGGSAAAGMSARAAALRLPLQSRWSDLHVRHGVLP